MKCPKCDKIFNKKVNLKQHIEWSHEGKTAIICNFCGVRYTSAHGLKKHMKAKHPQENKSQGWFIFHIQFVSVNMICLLNKHSINGITLSEPNLS